MSHISCTALDLFPAPVSPGTPDAHGRFRTPAPRTLAPRGPFALTLIALALALIPLQGLAQSSFTWNGGGGDNLWTTGGNWGGTAPGSPQAFLNFDGSTRTSNSNNFAVGSAGFQIYFKNTASTFTLNGNSINFFDFSATDPNIQNEGTVNTQTINFNIVDGNTHGANGILNINANTSPGQGPMVFNGTITSRDALIATRALNVSGPSQITFNGVISDFSSSGKIALTLLGSGTTILNATNTFTGDTSINNGTLRLAVNSALANGGNFIRLGDVSGTAGANLNLNGTLTLATPINVRSGNSGTKIFANTAGSTGTATFTGNLFLDANATVFANIGGAIALSGSILDLKNQTLTVDGGGNTTISGPLTNSTGAGNLTKNGSGTLTLTGSNSYAGLTLINAGVLKITNGAALGLASPGTIVNSGAQLQTSGTLTTADLKRHRPGQRRRASGHRQWPNLFRTLHARLQRRAHPKQWRGGQYQWWSERSGV
jgi:fibronectin-binding autotransporter adhesin